MGIKANETRLDGLTEGLYFLDNSKILYSSLLTYNFSDSSK